MAKLSSVGALVSGDGDDDWVVALTLVRHGESEGNLRKVCSEVQQNLTEKGVAQAHVLGKHLKCKGNVPPFDVAYCSDLARVKQTADIVLEHINGETGAALPLRVDPLLREKDPGEFAGRSRALIKQARKEFGCERTYAPGGGGESWDDVKHRAEQFLNELVKETIALPFQQSPPSSAASVPRLRRSASPIVRHVLVFTSGGFIKEFINAEVYKSSTKYYPNNSKNCAMFTFQMHLCPLKAKKERRVVPVLLNQLPDGMDTLGIKKASPSLSKHSSKTSSVRLS